MIVAQMLKESEMTEPESLPLVFAQMLKESEMTEPELLLLVLAQMLKQSEMTEPESLLLPVDYEPPFYRSCTEEKAHSPWTKNLLKMIVLAIKVKSVLDPCEDENDDILDDDVCLGDDSIQRDAETSDSEVIQGDENSESDSEAEAGEVEEEMEGEAEDDDEGVGNGAGDDEGGNGAGDGEGGDGDDEGDDGDADEEEEEENEDGEVEQEDIVFEAGRVEEEENAVPVEFEDANVRDRAIIADLDKIIGLMDGIVVEAKNAAGAGEADLVEAASPTVNVDEAVEVAIEQAISSAVTKLEDANAREHACIADLNRVIGLLEEVEAEAPTSAGEADLMEVSPVINASKAAVGEASESAVATEMFLQEELDSTSIMGSATFSLDSMPSSKKRRLD